MGCRITGKGKSHYGDYDIVGTLSRSQDGDNYAKIRFTKYKPAVPWYYNACDVCGAEDPVDTLLLCDGQDGRCKNASHAGCVGMDAVPDGEWFCADCSVRQCTPACICRVLDDPRLITRGTIPRRPKTIPQVTS